MVSPAQCTAIMEGLEQFGVQVALRLGQPWQAVGPLADPPARRATTWDGWQADSPAAALMA